MERFRMLFGCRLSILRDAPTMNRTRAGGGQISRKLSLRTGGPGSLAKVSVFSKQKTHLLKAADAAVQSRRDVCDALGQTLGQCFALLAPQSQAGCKLDGELGGRQVAHQLQLKDLTQTVLAPKSRRRKSNQFSKHTVQLGCIAKPYRERHVGNR
jgi:hypothetical protein